MKSKFLKIEFLRAWGSDEMKHEVGERAEVRDWIAKALVKRGIARLVEGDGVKKEGEVVESKGIKNI